MNASILKLDSSEHGDMSNRIKKPTGPKNWRERTKSLEVLLAEYKAGRTVFNVFEATLLCGKQEPHCIRAAERRGRIHRQYTADGSVCYHVSELMNIGFSAAPLLRGDSSVVLKVRKSAG